jgi:HD-GYP domain-containing protein (c-di-GMP phosphodiesterase class II)
MRFPEAVALGIQNLDEHWDGGGLPARLRGAAIPIYSRIALMAQVIDVFHTGNGVEAARREVRRRSGTWFDPHVAAAVERIAARREFWDTLRSNNLQQAIYALEPAPRVKTVDEDYLDDIAAAFAKVIDAKSPYTNGRCERVTLFAEKHEPGHQLA